MADVTLNTDFIQLYPTWAVRVSTDTAPGPATGSLPPRLKSDVNTQMIPRRVMITSGSQQLDFADIEWVYDGQLVDRTQPERFAKYCEVLFPSNGTITTFNTDGSTRTLSTNVRVVDGDYVTEAESVGPGGERLTGQIQRREYHFGVAATSVPFVFNVGGTPTVVEVEGRDIVFNPTVDGEVLPNRSSVTVPSVAIARYGWIDPEWGRYDKSKLALTVTPTAWTLREAVNAVCWLCNPDQEFIENPISSNLTNVLGDAPPIRDVLLNGGQYLPYYLDRLLHPYGYNWCVDYYQGIQSETDTTLVYNKPQIRVYQRGVGPERQLNWQRSGLWRQSTTSAPSSEAWSDINEYSLDRRIGDSYNRVIIYGDWVKSEVTIELWPAWLSADDGLSQTELDDVTGSKRNSKSNVHRVWRAGEDKSLDGLRVGVYGGNTVELHRAHGYWHKNDDGSYEYIGTQSGFQDLYSSSPAEPPLCFMGPDKLRFSDPQLEVSLDNGETWKRAEETYERLEIQWGVVFNGPKPPSASGGEWASAFTSGKLRLRMTGTVSSPYRLRNSLESQTGGVSVLGRENTLVLYMPDKFRLWRVLRPVATMEPGIATGANEAFWPEQYWTRENLGQSLQHNIGSIFGTVSVLQGTAPGTATANDQYLYGLFGADERDDRAAINEYARKVLAQSQNAEYDFEGSIPGWCTDWKIGDLITKINGRNISLNQSVDPGNPAYCQVTGIEYTLDEAEGPMTRLIVDRGTRVVVDPVPSNAPTAGQEKGMDLGRFSMGKKV